MLISIYILVIDTSGNVVSGACTYLAGFVLGVCGNLIIFAVFCLLGDKEELVRMLPRPQKLSYFQ